MKNSIRILLIPLIILFFSYQVLLSQSTDKKPPFKYLTKVISMDKSFNSELYLKEVKDSSISVMDKRNFKTKSIMIKDINELHFRKRNNELNGLLCGAFVGFAIGATIGYSQGDTKGGLLNSTAEEKAIFGGLIWSLPVGIIGGLIGSATKKNKINGNQNNYNAKKAKLEKYKY